MKPFLFAGAGVALLALAAPVSAQSYYPPAYYPPAYYPPVYAPPAQIQAPYYNTAAPGWTQDDGSSSDYPVPMPGDVSGEGLNAQYRDGIDVPPPNGLPAPYWVR